MSTNWICKTCGTQFPAAEEPPQACPICADERQYIGWNGQEWTTLDELIANRRNEIRPLADGLTGIATQPGFAIGQRAMLVQTPEGNLLWDCISLVDDATVAALHALGGVHAIAISHPHFYSSMQAWSAACNAPIYLHGLNRSWVVNPGPAIRFWEGETLPLFGGLTLVRCGGHFPGGTVLHWAGGAEGRGALLSGDIINVVQDRRWVSFMYSFPNQLPLPADSVRRVAAAVEPFAFERIYGGWWDHDVAEDAKNAVRRSAERYTAILEGRWAVE